MSYSPRTALSRWPILLLLLACSAKGLRAQVVNGFEGFVSGIRSNAVQGPVIYQRGEGKFNLEPGLRLDEGDVVHTGVNGFAELLLQPGNYLRLNSDTECQIFSDQHDKIRIKLNRGTANIEILARDGSANWFYSPDQANELIRVITPNAEIFIPRPGIFQINAFSLNQTELVSRDGEALINGYRIKEKRRGVAANGSVSINEIDARIEDGFDKWARERADKLVKANKSLKRDSWSKKVKEGSLPVTLEAPEEEQNDNRGRVISAKPGGVSFVEAGVEFGHGGEWQQL